MKILVTGGLGFVGINLVRALAEQGGVQVVAADLLLEDEAISRFLAPVRAQVLIERLDVCEASAVDHLLQAQAITHIVHAAAITATEQQEQARYAEIVNVNLLGAVNVLNSASRNPAVERVLLVSSSGVYGVPPPSRKRPQDEGDKPKLSNLYAITKYSAELLATRYGQLSGKMMASVRLPAVYGPLERSLPSRSNLSTIGRLMAALQAGRVIQVAGATVRRDWTYTRDIAAGVWALLSAPRWRYPVYNVSCGQAASFAEVVAVFVGHGLRATWVEDVEQAEIAMLPAQERAPLHIRRVQTDTDFRPGYSLALGVDDWLRAAF